MEESGNGMEDEEGIGLAAEGRTRPSCLVDVRGGVLGRGDEVNDAMDTVDIRLDW
jgi:hypothetical protein